MWVCLLDCLWQVGFSEGTADKSRDELYSDEGWTAGDGFDLLTCSSSPDVRQMKKEGEVEWEGEQRANKYKKKGGDGARESEEKGANEGES